MSRATSRTDDWRSSWRRLRPVRLWSSVDDPFAPVVRARLFLSLVLLGLAARVLRYALQFPLWEDEAFLCVSFIDRSLVQLTGALEHHQVAPLLFLWVERIAVQLFGFNELSLRLMPFLFSIAAFMLFALIVRRLLRGTTAVLAMAFFAPAYAGIRYAAEAKQYGGDLFVAAALIFVVVEWWRRPQRVGWLWVMALLVPPGVLLSYPAVFVGGGLSLWVAGVLWCRRQRRGIVPWAAMNVGLVGSFVALFAMSAKAQAGAELDFMQSYWGHTFPPMSEPWWLPWWFVKTHVSDLLAWPAGGARGASVVTGVAVFAGIVLLWRQRRLGVLALCVLPACIHLVAAAMHRYPYGGHVKFSMHLGPAICMLAGVGLAWLLSFRRDDRGRRSLLTALIILSLIGVGAMARDTVRPYKTQSDLRSRAFAQWFWFEGELDGEVLCINTDLDLGLSPKTRSELSFEAIFRCNEAIYRRPVPSVADSFAQDPAVLRCVLFRDAKQPFDDEALASWLMAMETERPLLSRTVYPLSRFDKRERRVVTVDHVEIFTFGAPYE